MDMPSILLTEDGWDPGMERRLRQPTSGCVESNRSFLSSGRPYRKHIREFRLALRTTLHYV